MLFVPGVLYLCERVRTLRKLKLGGSEDAGGFKVDLYTEIKRRKKSRAILIHNQVVLPLKTPRATYTTDSVLIRGCHGRTGRVDCPVVRRDRTFGACVRTGWDGTRRDSRPRTPKNRTDWISRPVPNLTGRTSTPSRTSRDEYMLSREIPNLTETESHGMNESRSVRFPPRPTPFHSELRGTS